MNIAPELKPILDQLKQEGFRVFTFYKLDGKEEIKGLIWYENGRVMVIQPSSWWSFYARERWTIGVCVIPSREYGSGYQLAGGEFGIAANRLLPCRDFPCPFRYYYKNYSTIEGYLKENPHVTEI